MIQWCSFSITGLVAIRLSRLFVDLHFLWGSLQNPTYFPVDISSVRRHIPASFFWSPIGAPLANSPQARKRAKQSEKRRAQNASQRSMVRTYIKRVHGAVEANNADAAGTALSQAVPIIDKMVTKGIMHKNQAARQKSRLNKRVKSLST